MESSSDVQMNSLWFSAMQSSKGLDLLSSAYVVCDTLYIHFPYICHASIRRLEAELHAFFILSLETCWGASPARQEPPLHPEAEAAWALQPD